MMAPLTPLVAAYHRFGMALSIAQELAINNGLSVPFAHDVKRMHETFRTLADAMGYRVVEDGESAVLVPRRDQIIEGAATVVRPTFGKRNSRPVPDGDGPRAA